MPERFVLLRGTPDGPVFLADPAEDSWTCDRDAADRWDTWDAADAERKALVVGDGVAVAVVPDRAVVHADLDYIRRAATARATRVGPGPDRPAVHGLEP